MAGSTPIYGFPYPESSDLVANYPALGQDLAEDIEGVIAGLGAGLNHINTTTFATQSTVSINNVFTSTYANYLAMLTITGVSADTNLRFRYRASGTDNAVNYYTAYIGVEQSSVTTSIASANDSVGYIGRLDSNTQYLSAMLQIYSPQLAAKTGMNTVTHSFNSTSTFEGLAGGVAHDNTGQFDGISLLPAAGTISGTIRIFGYKNS